MNEQDIPIVQEWLKRIRVNAERAIDLAGKMSSAELQESNPYFWALVKLAENVEESLVNVENLCKGIYDCLIEIPVREITDESEQLSWDALKGMRIHLAHKFWEIDPGILWRTVTEDFPKVALLLNSLRVIEEPHKEAEDIRVTISRDDFERLPVSEEGNVGPFKLGHSIAFLFFEEEGIPKGIRVGRSKKNAPLYARSPGRGGTRITIRG